MQQGGFTGTGGQTSIRVSINVNGIFHLSKVLYVDPDWSYMEFLNAASQRLNIVPAAKRVFNANGNEINDVMMIGDEEMLFFSHGEAFIPPKMDKNSSKSDRDGDRPDNTSSSHGGRRNTRRGSLISLGPFLIGDVLGKGGFGEVRMGINQLSGEKAALKFMRKSEIQSLHAVERTATEIQCLSTLKHPNIIQLLMHLETPKYVVLAFELMSGGDLYQFLSARGTTAQEIALPEAETRKLFIQILSGVNYAHTHNIIHRDLKLDNLLLKDASLREIKIADFGLSEYSRPGATLTGPRGTLSFQAPEIFSGSNYSGPPLDVWALGVILFAALTGRLPFEGGELNAPKRPRDALIKQKIMACQYKIDSHLSSDAKDLIKRMLRLDPVQRASVPELFGHAWVLPKNSFRVTPGATPSSSFLSPIPTSHHLSSANVPPGSVSAASMSLFAAMAAESTAKLSAEPPVPLATIYSPDDAPLDTETDKSDHHTRTPMSSSSSTNAPVNSSSAQSHNHNRDGNHSHHHRERGDRDPRSITPVRFGMVVSEKTVSTIGMSMTPTRFEHTQSDRAILSGNMGNTTTTTTITTPTLHHHQNMSSSKSTSKQHLPNQTSSISQIYNSSSTSSKTSNSTNHNHSLSISKSNSHSTSNLHSHLIGDDSLSTHLLGGGTAMPSSSSPSIDAVDAVDYTASIVDRPSQSPPSGRIKRRSMSHSDLPSLSDIAVATPSSSSSSSSAAIFNNKETANVGGNAAVMGEAGALPSSSSTRGPGLGLYSSGSIHTGSKQHLLDVNWSVDPLSSSSFSSSATSSASVTKAPSLIQGAVPVTHSSIHTLNTFHNNPFCQQTILTQIRRPSTTGSPFVDEYGCASTSISVCPSASVSRKDNDSTFSTYANMLMIADGENVLMANGGGESGISPSRRGSIRRKTSDVALSSLQTPSSSSAVSALYNGPPSHNTAATNTNRQQALLQQSNSNNNNQDAIFKLVPLRKKASIHTANFSGKDKTAGGGSRIYDDTDSGEEDEYIVASKEKAMLEGIDEFSGHQYSTLSRSHRDTTNTKSSSNTPRMIDKKSNSRAASRSVTPQMNLSIDVHSTATDSSSPVPFPMDGHASSPVNGNSTSSYTRTPSLRGQGFSGFDSIHATASGNVSGLNSLGNSLHGSASNSSHGSSIVGTRSSGLLQGQGVTPNNNEQAKVTNSGWSVPKKTYSNGLSSQKNNP